jgi:hypothetical protein
MTVSKAVLRIQKFLYGSKSDVFNFIPIRNRILLYEVAYLTSKPGVLVHRIFVPPEAVFGSSFKKETY